MGKHNKLNKSLLNNIMEIHIKTYKTLLVYFDFLI